MPDTCSACKCFVVADAVYMKHGEFFRNRLMQFKLYHIETHGIGPYLMGVKNPHVCCIHFREEDFHISPAGDGSRERPYEFGRLRTNKSRTATSRLYISRCEEQSYQDANDVLPLLLPSTLRDIVNLLVVVVVLRAELLLPRTVLPLLLPSTLRDTVNLLVVVVVPRVELLRYHFCCPAPSET
ncbi:hypothetical protein SARC_03194 [Sphaeroforma arctica JP610]|uniref:Uncharacterized protein n=1 Tax=Sphaeroforma arctica JP610 TaxID=667725 RepID=A0A0L0G6I1_9EUKA|nr:hypothetical protein SARC_03194 [Sphaeroforma arctica JP610]KNC84597.1 hypothetical protein SARC_03194 [Sphaeroforma arctica JP610]|eukprot:XP_014158499.1 hypothetical protein SARC_03194 [Sphaeroforma arctica JP610]